MSEGRPLNKSHHTKDEHEDVLILSLRKQPCHKLAGTIGHGIAGNPICSSFVQ